MKTSKVSAAKVAARYRKHIFVKVNDIYKETSPFARADEAKILVCQGFKICIIGYMVYIQVDDSQRTMAAYRYATNIMMSRCRHHFDNEAYIRQLEDMDGIAFMKSIYGGKYIEELNAAKQESFKTDVPGVFIENSFRPFESVEEVGA